MLRSFVRLLSFVFLTLLCAMTTDCGSSGSGGGNGGGPYNVVGNWQVNFSSNIGATASGYGAINSSGLAAFFDSSGNIVNLPAITGATSFTGNLTAYAVNGTFFPDGSTVETAAAEGQVNSATSIAGTFTSNTNPSGSFSVVPYSPLSGSVVAVSGAMNGKIIGFVDTLNLTFSSDGSFTGVDYYDPQLPGCSVAGTLAQEKPNNVFDITFSYVSGNCLTATQTGIGFESKTDYFNVNGGAAGTYLYAIMLTSTLASVHPYVVVIHQ
jgi:hypothetical protein